MQPYCILWRFQYSNVWEQNGFTRNKRGPVNNDRSTIFEKEHYTGIIVLIWETVVKRSLLEFYLFLTVATLFLLKGFFIILALLLTIVVLFNLLSSWLWDSTSPFSRFAIRFLQYFTFIFSLLILENGL